MNHLESKLQTALLLAAPRVLPNLRLFRRNVGTGQMASGNIVSFGIGGQADLYALVRGGMHIEVELKQAGAPKKRPKDDETLLRQQAWADFCREWQIPHIVLRAMVAESVDETVQRWCSELGELVREK